MDDLTSSNTENVEPSPKRRRTFWLAAGVIAILGAIFLLLRQSPGEEPRTAKADGVFAPGVIEATPEQLKQIRIEPVREQTIDLNLEATGKVAFNEDRLTPVLASYPGRRAETACARSIIDQRTTVIGVRTCSRPGRVPACAVLCGGCTESSGFAGQEHG